MYAHHWDALLEGLTIVINLLGLPKHLLPHREMLIHKIGSR